MQGSQHAWSPFFARMVEVIRHNLSHGWCKPPPSMVSRMFEVGVPYRFLPVRDMQGAPRIWTAAEVQARGFAACSEAAAAIAAAAINAGRAPTLCVKATGDGAHVTTTVDGVELDPYRLRWLAGHDVCDGRLEVDPAWFVDVRQTPR